MTNSSSSRWVVRVALLSAFALSALGCDDTSTGSGDSGVDADAGTDGTDAYVVPDPTAKRITKLSFTRYPDRLGVIDHAAHTVTVTLPFGAFIDHDPAVCEYVGIGCSPNASGQLDWSAPVVYTVTAEDFSTVDYTVTVVYEGNPNVDLQKFALQYGGADHPLTPTFSASVTSYIATVGGATTGQVIAWSADAGATVTMSSNANALVPGSNTVTATVTQPNGPTKVYTVVVTRLPANDLYSDRVGVMRSVPAGTFQRDATATNTSGVSAFRMSATEITRAMFTAVSGLADPTYVSDPSRITGTSDPVDGVSWWMALVFCNRLSLAEGLTPVYAIGGETEPLVWGAVPTTDDGWSTVTADWSADGYRLPTEMEWLWAAMGATSGHGYAGSGTYTDGYAKPFAGSDGANAIGDYDWNVGNCKNANDLTQTRPVGTKLPNELGIFDLSGSAYEWVWDNYPGGPTPIPDGPLTDYRGSTTWSDYHRVYGGSFSFVPSATIAASAYGIKTATSALTSYHVGFRVVRR